MSDDRVPTPSSTVGPFLHIGLTDRHSLVQIAVPDAKGERIHLSCRIFDGDGVPLNDAMIEIWQADSQGRYPHPHDPRSQEMQREFLGFGRAATDENGCCEFETIKPGCVPGPEGKPQAPHLNVAIYARGILLQLYTRIYLAGEPANEDDSILALVPTERRKTLLAHRDSSHSNGWLFEIHLRGDNETVFFDV